MPRKKQEIITFKVDASLMKALEAMPNRSEFIRAAILSAMNNVCPLCSGTGYLTPDQRRHWDEFSAHHVLEKCDECEAVHLVCESERAPRPKRYTSRKIL
ncbi:MAG TPA: ribbon-helix-helix domain-containing protein [Candidatus Hydrogenedentes bacterium]|nr:ribbon-helix-helix domain-containing protein [Candidatus Hydrogenedentota bacterium]HOL75490.1 ribbon-helix-helix domain-containing protein [Candidatus Hydrogenedentota bacterium]HPO86068.1 ribbon-helix-helix domain-containing protein [Candidatus Hydrogenedentota bacterium]